MIAKLSVVLDACVLIPQYLRDTLLSVAWQGLYYPYWSQLILEETSRNLIKRYNINSNTAINLVAQMRSAFPEAMVEVPPGLIELMTNDLKDRHVLATAVSAKADIIVTNNLNDFPESALDIWGIISQSPDTFLSDLFDQYTEEIKLSLIQQVKKYKNPQKSLDELLEFLDKKAKLSNFCQKVKFGSSRLGQ